MGVTDPGSPLTQLSLTQLRQRTSIKWRTHAADVLPLWVAEMDVTLAPPIVEALTGAIARGDTGYPAGTGYAEALRGFAARRWSWDGLDVVRTALVPDVMMGIVEIVRLVTEPGDTVVVCSPVYPPFYAFVSHADRRVLEALREPLESGCVHISRAAYQVAFPARFQLVAAMNPCPCGYFGAPSGKCRCTPDQVVRYRSRLSGPLLDRIDLHVEVPALAADALQQAAAGEASASVRGRVAAALARQRARQGKANARLTTREIDLYCRPGAAGSTLLREALARLDLSARAYHRVLRVARSIADLAGCANLEPQHIAEAVHYRRLAKD